MRFLRKIALFFLLVLAGTCCAADAFLVQHVRVQGLQRLDERTVIHYFPIKVGQRIDLSGSCGAIQALYQTGFFSDIRLAREGNTLVVNVVERATIGTIEIVGNKDLPEDKLKEFLKSLGLSQGATLNNSVLDKVQKSLQAEYYNRGRYNARVCTEIVPQSRNRVGVKIVISEGRTALIRDIEIIGNHAFSRYKLIRQIPINTSKWWSFFTHGDQYTRQKLNDSVKAIECFYQDHGYARFHVDSAHVELTPDKKDVAIVIHITEGPCYKFCGYRLSGDLVLPESRLKNSIHLKPGATYSKLDIDCAVQAIKFDIGDMGYAFPTVNVIPEIDDQKRQVFLNFYISPGSRFYVRHIHFCGNIKTADMVLRNQMKQFEGALVSSRNIEESKRRLNILGYLQDIQVETVPVPNAENLADLEYHVSESPSAQAAASVGYGTNGWIFNTHFNQANFLGTGRAVGINFNTTLLMTGVSLSYNNPFYTVGGVQRGFSVYGQRTTPGKQNLAKYTTDSYGAAVTYSFPVSECNDNIQLGYGYQYTDLHIGSQASLELINFVEKNGNVFDQFLVNAGWSRDGRNRALFPTNGVYQSASVQLMTPLGNHPLEYYKTNYFFSWYRPLFCDDFVFNARANVGYGNGYRNTDGLPFFVNYYAGGIGFPGAVRGYQTNTLGPRDTTLEPLGGNLLLVGGASLTFPNFITEELRTGVFVDVGNVYNTDPQFCTEHSGPLRSSVGLFAEWNLPFMGVIEISFAKPLNDRPGDQLQFFQFTMGRSF